MIKYTFYFLSFSLLNLFAVPPRNIPPHLYDRYTQNNTIPVLDYYIDDTVEQTGIRFYSKQEVNKLIEKVNRREHFYYGITDIWLYQILDRYPDMLKDKSVAIMGSTTPWYEAITLAYGGIPTTIEYNKIHSDDPRLHLLTVDEYRKDPKKFDVIISISSFEHDGLGRYGDPLNPDGDLMAMKICYSMLKSDGKLLLAVPVGKDCLVWNAHRIYGEKRLPKLLKNFEILDCACDYREFFDYPEGNHFEQPVFLLTPKK